LDVVHCTSQETEIVKRKDGKRGLKLEDEVIRNETSEALPNEQRGGGNLMD
jgi:hypothetical protein